MTYQLPALPYAYDALAPNIDAKTMEIHHTKHHQTYINNLNKALEGNELANLPVDQLIREIERVPANLRDTVRNNGGGHANHSLFWTVMTDKFARLQPGKLASAIDSDLGGMDSFKEKFTQAAIARFGSGWAWLCVDNGRLIVEHTGNQDSPLMQQHTPVLGLDVWEHAYYLQYQNRRPEYIAAFFNVINWAEVEQRFAVAS